MDTEKKLPIFGQRHAFVLVMGVALFTLIFSQASLSVALIAMVNKTNTKNVSINDECPVAKTNSTISTTATKNGEFNWSHELQGYILSAFFWGNLVLQIPAGIISKKYSAKWLIGIGLLWTSALTLLTELAAKTSVYFFIVLRFLEGVGQGMVHSASYAILARWAPPEETSTMFAIATLIPSLGLILSQALAGPLCNSSFLGGWPSIFYLSGGLGVLWFIPWCFFAYDYPDQHPRITVAERNYIMSASQGFEEDADTKKKAIPWKNILLSRHVWAYVVAQIMGAWVLYTAMTCLPQFLEEVLHLKIVDNGIISSTTHLSFSVLTFVFSVIGDKVASRGWFSKTVTKKFFTAFAFIGCAACLLGITFVSCDRTSVIVFLVLSFGVLGATTAGYASCIFDMSPEYSGPIGGLEMELLTITGLLTPIVTDYITVHKTIHEWNIVFYLSSGLCLFGTIQFLVFGTAEAQNFDKDSKGYSDI